MNIHIQHPQRLYVSDGEGCPSRAVAMGRVKSGYAGRMGTS